MLCKSFDNLSHKEKVEFIGMLCHACQSNESLFSEGSGIIKMAKYIGLFDNVKILPNGNEEENSTGSNADVI